MTLRSRIFLIVSGIVIFFMLAPLAVLLARGYYLDFPRYRLVKTGALVIETEPRDAQVVLNNQGLKQTTPLTKRFLIPGEYSLEIKKTNFRPWKKRVTVYEQQVTSLPQGETGKITLFLETPGQIRVSTTTQEFLTAGSDLLGPPAIDAYYIATSTRKLLLKNPNGEDQELTHEPLPKFTQSQIIRSPARQIFLLLDKDLYEVMEKLEKLNSNIAYVAWNDDLPGLIYGNEHEVWLYPTDKQTSFLVTRSSRTLGQGQYNQKTGYVFVAEDHEIKAIEFDNSGQPNIYVLAESQTPLPEFSVNDEGTQIIYLDGQDLITLKIR